MDIAEYFNSVAFRWDEMCKHDIIKLRKIIKMSCLKNGSKILDVGTGTGILVSYLLESCPSKITAIDISENMIKVARGKYDDIRVEFVVEDIMKFNKSGYDYAFIYSAYPHFEDKEELFRHISELMNADGKIIIAHSESREAINNMHQKNKYVSNDILPSGKVTSLLMSKYFEVDKIVDSSEMYYVSGIKK